MRLCRPLVTTFRTFEHERVLTKLIAQFIDSDFARHGADCYGRTWSRPSSTCSVRVLYERKPFVLLQSPGDGETAVTSARLSPDLYTYTGNRSATPTRTGSLPLSPFRIAYMVMAAALCSCNFRIKLERCFSTVLGLKPRSRAIALLE